MMGEAALYLILIANGAIGGTWGPLPYDEAECWRRATAFVAEAIQHEETSTWRMVCEYHDVRPELGEPAP